MTYTEFHEDDQRYRSWLETSPSGYVLNCVSRTSIGDARLHRATCPDLLAQLDRVVRLTFSYRKYCSEDLGSLERLTAAPVQRCQHCFD
jgi:hypothetical protein